MIDAIASLFVEKSALPSRSAASRAMEVNRNLMYLSQSHREFKTFNVRLLRSGNAEKLNKNVHRGPYVSRSGSLLSEGPQKVTLGCTGFHKALNRPCRDSKHAQERSRAVRL